MLQNASIRRILLIVFFPLVLVLAGQSLVTIRLIQTARTELEFARDTEIEAYVQLSQFVIELGINQQRYQLLAQQDIQQIPFERIVYETFAAQDELEARLEAFLATRENIDLSDEELELIALVRQELDAYNEANKTVEETYLLFEQLSTHVGELLAFSEAGAEEAITHVSGNVRNVAATTLTVGIVVTLVTAILGLLAAVSLQRPLRRLEATIGDIAQGDGDLRVRLNFATSRNEVGRVAVNFNEFIGKLHDIVVAVRSSLSGLSESGGELASNAEQTAAAVSQIASTTDSIAGRIEAQHRHVESATSAADDIIAQITHVSDLINEQSAAVTQSSASIEQMVANIKSVTDNVENASREIAGLVAASDKGQEMLASTLSMIRTITEQSDALQSANTIISDLAERTNLLAMNAAIEAAHAGESGRGFAVVASEIRTLAVNSNEQSSSIRERLREINTAIEEVSAQSNVVDQAFSDVSKRIGIVTDINGQVHNAMQEQSEGSRQILAALEEITSSTTDVQDRANDMRQRSIGVQTGMDELSKVSGAVRAGIEEVAAGTAEINKAVDHVRDLTGQNRRLIERTDESIRQFQVEESTQDGPDPEELAALRIDRV